MNTRHWILANSLILIKKGIGFSLNHARVYCRISAWKTWSMAVRRIRTGRHIQILMDALALWIIGYIHQKAKNTYYRNDYIQFRACIKREISFHSLRKLTASAIVPLFLLIDDISIRTTLTSLKMLSSVLPFTVKYPARFATRSAYWWCSDLAWDGGNSHRVLHQPLQRCIGKYEGTLGMDM